MGAQRLLVGSGQVAAAAEWVGGPSPLLLHTNNTCLVVLLEAPLDHAAYVVRDGQPAKLGAWTGLDGCQKRVQTGGCRQERRAAVHGGAWLLG